MELSEKAILNEVIDSYIIFGCIIAWMFSDFPSVVFNSIFRMSSDCLQNEMRVFRKTRRCKYTDSVWVLIEIMIARKRNMQKSQPNTDTKSGIATKAIIPYESKPSGVLEPIARYSTDLTSQITFWHPSALCTISLFGKGRLWEGNLFIFSQGANSLLLLCRSTDNRGKTFQKSLCLL